MAADELGKHSPDGSRLGQATSSLVAFYGSTPVVQPTSTLQGAVSIGALSGDSVVSLCVSLANANRALVNEIRASLVRLGLMAGS